MSVTPGPGRLRLRGVLPAGAAQRFVICIPGWSARTNDLPAPVDVGRLREAAADHWTRLLADTTQVDVPVPLLGHFIRSTQVHCLMAARNESDAARVAPWIAADTYGPLDTEAQAVILGMDLMGHHEFARRCHEFFIHSYSGDGLLAKGYTLMGTGQHLWTLAEHFKRTKDTEWLRGCVPDLLRSCEWIERQLEKTKKLDAQGRPLPEYGLMPPGVLADWNRYAYYFYANAHFQAGLRGVADMLADIGHPRAERIRSLADEYRANILRAYRWNQARMPVVPLRDGTWVPPCPSSLYCFGLTRDFYGGVSATGHDVEVGGNHLIPLGLIEPDSREAERIIDYMEDRWFLIDGIFGAYPAAQNEHDWFNRGGFSKLQPHYTRTADIHALRDDVKPFIRTYFNTFPVLLNRENLTYWEHMNNGGAWDKTHESGWFLQMTRTMLLTERRDELWLAPSVPCNWLRDGMSLAIRNAPTYFGPISYRLDSHVAAGFVEAEIDAPRRTTPGMIALRIRHPEGKPIRTVRVDGRSPARTEADGQTIRIEPADAVIRLHIEF